MLPIQLMRRRRLKRRAKRLGSYAAASRCRRSAFSAFVSLRSPSAFSTVLPVGQAGSEQGQDQLTISGAGIVSVPGSWSQT